MKITKIKKLLLFCIVSIVTLTSCEEDNGIKLTSLTSCSPDLLEFVTPVVTISTTDGYKETFVLSQADFANSNEGGSITIDVNTNVNVNINDRDANSSSVSSVTTNYISYMPSSPLKFSSTSLKGEIKVSYRVKDNYKLNKENYVFFHNVGYKYTLETDISMTSTVYFKPIAQTIRAEKVEEYLKKLAESTDRININI